MSARRILIMVARDLKPGWHSPFLSFVLVLPLLIWVIMVVTPQPDPHLRVGIVDHGRSTVASALETMHDIRLTVVGTDDELRERVGAGALDGGLILADDFDAKVRAGERPPLEFFLSGGSFPSRRVLLAATTIDLVRQIEERDAPVEVAVNRVGDGRMLSAREMRVLFMTAMMLSVAGIMLPALSISEERQAGTLRAVLMTPTRMPEVLISKAAVAFLVGIATSFLTLLMNSGLSHEPGAVIATLAVATAICVATGLLFGTIARDSKGVFALSELLFILFLGTMLLMMGSGWGQFGAKFIPTYWFLRPLFQIAVLGAGFNDVSGNLLVGLGLAAALAVCAMLLGRRMEARLAAA